jgi:hypothetical protein
MTSKDVFSGMNETEMAFYARFKLSHYSIERRTELKTALKKKGLTKQRIKQIVDAKKFDSAHLSEACKRCGSLKVYTHEVGEAKTEKHCLICDYIEKPHRRSPSKFLSFLFGK